LTALTRDNVSAEALAFRNCRQTYVAGVPVVFIRISFSGEIGYEIYCKPHYLLRLAEAIEQHGAALGFKWYGARALMSLRLEKGWGAWGLDYRPDFTPAEAGLNGFINWTKEFVGKAAAQKQKTEPQARKLVTMTIDVNGINVSNNEAILKDGQAMGYVNTEQSATGTRLEVEILGHLYPAKFQGTALYDPSGGRLRGLYGTQ
jgi:dimethylglycine dehydrogenase